MQQIRNHLESFKASIPTKPYATDELGYGLKIHTKEKALLKRYLSVNHRYYLKWLVFDLDMKASLVEYQYSMVGVPTPNLIIENPLNGHSHFLYELDQPIYLSDAARDKPIRYANAVYNALRERLGADIGYSGLITKNALHEHWRVYSYRSEPYTLAILSEKLELSSRQIKKPIEASETSYLGRNCKVFDDVRHWAYVAIRGHRGSTYQDWFKAVLKQCEVINCDFIQPLAYNELKAIAKSISRWVWKRDAYAYQEFIERQRCKGKLGGKAKGSAYEGKRQTALKLKAEGLSYTSIAAKLNVSRRSVINWCK